MFIRAQNKKWEISKRSSDFQTFVQDLNVVIGIRSDTLEPSQFMPFQCVFPQRAFESTKKRILVAPTCLFAVC